MRQNKKKKRKLKMQFKVILCCLGIFLLISLFNLIQWKMNESKREFIENRKVVVIDIGHGGNDQGTQSNDGSKIEKNITLQIGNKVIQELEKDKNIKVVSTRNSDEYVSLKDRNKIEKENKGDIFVSIHANATADYSKSANGVETFYFKEDNDESKKLAELIHNNIILSTSSNDRGVKKGNYQVLRDSDCPSILIETGFLTNYVESSNLSNPNYQNQIANAIVKGIKEYIKPIDEDVQSNEEIN